MPGVGPFATAGEFDVEEFVDGSADDYPKAIAEAHESGDSARAHALIAAQESGEQVTYARDVAPIRFHY